MIKTITDFDLLPEEDSNTPPHIIKPEIIHKSLLWTYFDGYAQEAGCGGGAILYLNETHCFKIQMRLGRGTNNYAELCTTKHFMHFALEKHCRHLQLFGDSKIVCSWLNRSSHCNAYSLRNILEEAHKLIATFDSFAYRHIYKEKNLGADYLSKEAALRQSEDWLIREEVDGTFHQHYRKPFLELRENGL